MPILASKMVFLEEWGRRLGMDQVLMKAKTWSSLFILLSELNQGFKLCEKGIIIARRAFFTRLVEQAQKTKFFWIDDAWVTGMLGKHRKTHRNHAKCLYDKILTCKGT